MPEVRELVPAEVREVREAVLFLDRGRDQLLKWKENVPVSRISSKPSEKHDRMRKLP